MAHCPDAPCAGGCGTLLWGGRGSLSAGERICRPCRRLKRVKACEVCGKSFQPSNRARTCSVTCGQTFRLRQPRPSCVVAGCQRSPRRGDRCGKHRPENVERQRARYRDQTSKRRRKRVEQYTDITPAYESALRAKVKRCPICNVRLINRPYKPASKELDHIVPLNVGGTHTVGNVRIICRACNVRRPADGSDYAGQVTLWAQVPLHLVPTQPRRSTSCTCGTPLRRGRCWTCRPARAGRNGMAVTQVRERERQAAAMRDAGHKWQLIADQLGFKSPGAAYLAAERSRTREAA